MPGPVFEGVGVALATLFDDEGSLDASATAEHAARLVELGVRAVVVAGSTGEAAALDRGERVSLLDAVRTAVAGRVPVIAGTGAPSARQAAELTRDACDHGADAVLALSPPGAADARPYYDTVVDAADAVPVLAYHFPTVSRPGLDLDTLADLTAVSGLKDSSADPDRLLEVLDAFAGPVWVGSSALLVQAGAVGCAGGILALANVEPERCARALEGDGDAQVELAPFHLAARQSFPRGLKNLMAERWATSPVTRMG